MRRQAWLVLVAVACDLSARALAAGASPPIGDRYLAITAILLIACFPLVGMGLGGGVMAPTLDRYPRAARTLEILLPLAGVGMCMPTFLHGMPFEISSQGIRVAPGMFELFLLGFFGIVFGIFSGSAFLLRAAASRMTSVRTKFVMLGMASCGATVAAAVVAPRIGLIPELVGWARAIVLFLVVSTIVYGFCGFFSYELSRWFAEALPALAAFGRGETDVRLDESPRDETGLFARTFNAAVGQRLEAQFLERAFGRYVAPAVLEALRPRPDRPGVSLDTRRLEATVLYADIRGFTRFSESETPEEVMRVLNVYFERMIEVIGSHEGFINKFIGDAVMVVFGAPLEQPDHAARGVRCALAMQQALAGMNSTQAFGAGRKVEIGIGVNTGSLVAGSLGSETRAEYTVIGDTVNVAARLTSSAKPGEILVGSETASASGAAGLEEQPPLMVKGKSMPLAVYRLAAA